MSKALCRGGERHRSRAARGANYATLVPLYGLFLLMVALAGCSSTHRRPEMVPPSGYRFDIFPAGEGRSLDTFSELFGIPRGVLEVVNTLPPGGAASRGDGVVVPFFNELFPTKPARSLVSRSRRGATFSPGVHAQVGRIAWPVLGGSMSSSFGPRGRTFHEGVDIKARAGVPIFAAHGGTVVYAGDGLRGYGNLIVVEGEGLSTVYGHNSFNLVSRGDQVQIGDPIGMVGSTGKATGPHVHFETRVRNSKGHYVAIDPLFFFSPPSGRVFASRRPPTRG